MNSDPIFSNKFLSRPPSWMMKWGTLLVFTFFATLIAFSTFIKYNEVIHAEILVTSENPPVDLFSRKDGKLVYMNFESGRQVLANDILAVIESPSKYEDVFYLKKQLQDTLITFKTLNDLYQTFPSDLELESDIHLSYQDFLKAFQNYLLYLDLNEGEVENKNINSRITRLKQQIRIKENQLFTVKRNYTLSQQKNNRQKTLFDKGVISKQQLDASEQELLLAKNDINKVREELEILHVDTLSLNNLSSKSLNKNIINASVYFSELQLAKQEIKSKIDQWENTNALKSPISGKVTVFDIWNNYQNVTKGEHILTIVPKNKDKIIGKCKVPIRNSAKLIQGQDVIIKLDNYPYHEWGLLKGKVLDISETPKKGNETFYSMQVSIPNLETSYGKKIQFKQEMVGNAKIILLETSLFERVFYEFRRLWTDVSY